MSPVACPEETTEKHGSPGLIGNDELIAYLLFSPDDIVAGKVQPTAFPVKRLKKKGDLSTSRPSHTTLKTIQDKVVTPRQDGGSQCHGALTASAKAIRDIIVQDLRQSPPVDFQAFCVIDDPDLPNEYPGHSVIQFSDHTRPDFWGPKNIAAAAQGNLLLAFEASAGPLKLEDVFANAA